ncbi:unnamed protein product [Fusarium venenatum]|uniref:Uncharacterized protein n=1 Tax=Fusarium venenatum TaxID=56646 RepID=A0A2L2STC0_9HYPO|nr:uncharacterized protein FVRRES_04958 [Fusarium venenatum]CEI60522.1 unnamed protein product [Fusarium venenatum]
MTSEDVDEFLYPIVKVASPVKNQHQLFNRYSMSLDHNTAFLWHDTINSIGLERHMTDQGASWLTTNLDDPQSGHVFYVHHATEDKLQFFQDMTRFQYNNPVVSDDALAQMAYEAILADMLDSPAVSVASINDAADDFTYLSWRCMRIFYENCSEKVRLLAKSFASKCHIEAGAGPTSQPSSSIRSFDIDLTDTTHYNEQRGSYIEATFNEISSLRHVCVICRAQGSNTYHGKYSDYHGVDFIMLL